MKTRMPPGLLGVLALAASMGPAVPMCAAASWPAVPRRHEPTEESKEIQNAAELKRQRRQQRNLTTAKNVQRGPGVA